MHIGRLCDVSLMAQLGGVSALCLCLHNQGDIVITASAY